MVTPIRIYPWATDTAGCFYQRLRLPLDALVRAYPDEFVVRWNEMPDLSDLGSPRVVIGQRIMGNGEQADPRWVEYCERPSILAVYEIDDDILDLDPGNAVPYSIFTPNRAGTIRNIWAANIVIASTRHLARKLVGLLDPDTDRLDLSRRVAVAENCIADGSVIERNWPDQMMTGPTIGWAGSMFHQQDFPPELVAEFDAIAAAYPNSPWVSIGANYFGSPWHGRTSTFGWSDIERYHKRLTMLDIGLAPIQRTTFNASKSWIKVLDYMSRGVIPVATSWGQYPELINDEINGLLVDEPIGCWREALDWLLDDREAGRLQLVDMRQEALNTARDWEISKHVHKWADVFRLATDL